MHITNYGTAAVTLALPAEYAPGFNGTKVISNLKRIVLRPGENSIDDVVITSAGKHKILDFIRSSKPLLGMVREGLLKVTGLEKEFNLDADKVTARMQRLDPLYEDEQDGNSELAAEVAQLRALVEGQAKLIESLTAPQE